MANAFWGGFASSLKERLDSDFNSEQEFKRQRMLMELKKEFEAEIIDNQLTQIEGNEEVLYNKYGEVLRRRQLSPDQIAARQAELQKVQAEARRAGAEADVKVKDSEFYDDDRKRKLDNEAADNRRADEQVGISRGHLGVAQERLSLDRDNKDEAKDMALDDEIAQIQGMMSAIAQGDKVSDRVRAEAANADLQAALVSGDKRKIRSTIKRIASELQFAALRGKTAATTRAGGGSDFLEQIRAGGGLENPDWRATPGGN